MGGVSHIYDRVLMVAVLPGNISLLSIEPKLWMQEKLAMLDAVEHAARLRQALKLLARSLHTVRQALGQKKDSDSKQPDGGWAPVLGTIGQGVSCVW